MAAAGHASPRPTFDWSDPTWMVDARCADVLDIDWFDLGCGLDEAVKLCQVCPVRGECLAYAVQHGIIDGIWGGVWGIELIETVEGRGRGKVTRQRRPRARGEGEGQDG